MSDPVDNSKSDMKNLLFFSTIGAAATFIGFSSTLALTKKRYQTIEVNSQGLILGFKALGIATLISLVGFGGICWGTSKLFDIKNLNDLKYKARNILPRISRNSSSIEGKSQGKIETFEDLMKVLEGK